MIASRRIEASSIRKITRPVSPNFDKSSRTQSPFEPVFLPRKFWKRIILVSTLLKTGKTKTLLWDPFLKCFDLPRCLSVLPAKVTIVLLASCVFTKQIFLHHTTVLSPLHTIESFLETQLGLWHKSEPVQGEKMDLPFLQMEVGRSLFAESIVTNYPAAVWNYPQSIDTRASGRAARQVIGLNLPLNLLVVLNDSGNVSVLMKILLLSCGTVLAVDSGLTDVHGV